MHYTAVAIFKTDSSTIRKFKDNLSKKHKYYLSDEYIKTIAALEKIDESANTNLIQKLKEYTGEEIGIDEKGIYGISTKIFKDNSISLFAKKLEKPFSRFDHNREVKEYKYYLSKKDIKDIAEHYKIDVSDLNAIAEKLKDWDGQDKGGVDQKGVYGLSTKNREGKFDYWNAFDLMTTEELLNNLDKIDRFPHVIFTPDCKWIEAPEYFMFIDASSSNYQSYLKWENRVREILRRYSKNSIALLIDCHT